MEIHALKLLLTDHSINRLAAEALGADSKLRDVRVRFAVEGAYVQGVYQMLFGVPFETLWELSVRGGRIAARLASLKVARVPAGLARSMLLGSLAEAVRPDQGLHLEEDTLLLDLDRLLASKGLPARTNLTVIQCRAGSLVIESSSPGL